jgi:hypothetical protein
VSERAANGADQDAEAELSAAQRRLLEAIKKQPLDPTGAAISAYANSVLQSARVDALAITLLEPQNGSWGSPKEAYESNLVAALNRLADALEANASRVQTAPASILARPN